MGNSSIILGTNPLGPLLPIKVKGGNLVGDTSVIQLWVLLCQVGYLLPLVIVLLLLSCFRVLALNLGLTGINSLLGSLERNQLILVLLI